MQWLRKLLGLEYEKDTALQLAIKSAQQATGTDMVMIVSCQHIPQTHNFKVALAAPETMIPLQFLDYAYQTLIEHPEQQYTRQQVQQQLDFWLEKLSELEKRI